MKTKRTFLLASLALAAMGTMRAALPVGADYDAYSYVFVGVNYDSSPTVNISQYNPAGHFTFGVAEYDVSGVSTDGDKYLLMNAAGYTDGSPTGGSTWYGMYTMNVGVLTASYSDYLSAGNKTAWFNTNVMGLTPIGTMTFVHQYVTALDVTSTVNSWINESADNYGFVFWGTDAGAVHLNSSDSSAYTPSIASAIPEPQTYAMFGGVAALGIALLRRRKLSLSKQENQ